jgi:hypothetical protein
MRLPNPIAPVTLSVLIALVLWPTTARAIG